MPQVPNAQFQRRRLIGGLATLPAWALCGGTAKAADAVSGKPPAEVAAASAALQRTLRERISQQGVGLQAFELDAGQGLALAAAGPVPASEQPGLFELGSITKTFTALLLADASLRGELRLDDPLEPVLDLPLRDKAGQPLRWIDLATHRSGLPRLPANLQPRRADDPYADYSWADMQIFLRGWQPTRGRGERYEYSNLGYGLLGQALALRTGRPFDALLGERVLRPLKLDSMVLAPPAGVALAQGHDAAGKPVAGWRFQPAMAGAGALLGSARDLATYARAALGQTPGRPLAEAFALCLRRHADGAAPINPVGLAWNLAPLDGRTVFNHDGGTGGFSSSLWLDPERGRAAGVLANAAVPVTDLGLHLLDRSVPPKDFSSTRQNAQSLPAEQLSPLAGVYAFNSGFKLRISARGSQLFAQATGQGEFELFAKAPRRFFARITPLEIVFDGEAANAAPALTLLQGGQTLRFVREP